MQLTHEKLFSLEQYARIRIEFRNKVIKHKANRMVTIGQHATLYFEDSLTMQYQVQEMLRLERIFEPEGIQQELDVYNPLIPDGSNWKATFMLEYEDVEERRVALARLIGIEKTVWAQVEGYDKVYAVANEDLTHKSEDKTAEDKTSAVHFLRFELTPEMVASIKQGVGVRAGISHPNYNEEVKVSAVILNSLAGDLVS